MFVRVLKWICFSGLVSLLPLGIAVIVLTMHNQYRDASQLYERGELMLISATLLATAMGDIMTSGFHRIRTKVFVGAVTVALLVGTSVWYATTLESIIAAEAYNHVALLRASPWMFSFSMAAGLACVMLSEEPRL